MADVAKSTVRAECCGPPSAVVGGGEDEEDEPSLSSQIESELRERMSNKNGWTDPDAGWATVEEVALELSSHPLTNGHASADFILTERNDPQLLILETEDGPPALAQNDLLPTEHTNGDLLNDSLTTDEPTHNEQPLTNGDTKQSELTEQHTTTQVTEHGTTQIIETTTTQFKETVTTQIVEHTEIITESVSVEGVQVIEDVRDCMDAVLDEVSQPETDTSTNEDNADTEILESSTVEKKKKKKTVMNGESEEDVTAVKKKTKKTKRAEGKENSHISIIPNGHGPDALPPSAMSHLEDNDLSNVCVKDLKLNYVNEASKSFSSPGKVPSEVPVLPTVPIRELRRSFGDIHKACENADAADTVESNNSDKQLAARYWRTVSIENNLNENTSHIGRLDKSSFSKFDQLSKKTVLHVRSSDSSKAQKTFNQGSSDGQAQVNCKACQKQVFAMEQIKAERNVWHKNCFRCHTCNKQLTVDIYQSHEGELYCKPHFRELFQPKAVVDAEEEPVRRRKPEMIIRENQPVELPPDVVRASDKPDLGLEELSSLNVKSRFQVFEKQDQADGELERSPTTVSVKRSSSIMSKLAKFQKKGMDVGVTDESLNGFVCEESSSSEEESEEDGEEDKGVIKCRRMARERPVSFGKMDDVKKNWESMNQSQRREEMREERKLELQQIRSRIWQGKQGKMKEMYEQAVAESESRGGRKESLKEDEELSSLSDKAKLTRERFEKGEVGSGEGHESGKKELEEDMAVFEEGISKKSRNIFKEMEAATKAAPLVPNHTPPAVNRTESIRRPRETDSPEREVYRDPDVVRCDDKVEDEKTILRSQTASRMLSVFRQLEEQKEVIPDGPKPKKCFTPPPDYKGTTESSEEVSEEDEEEETEEEEESETEDGVVKSSYKVKDEFLEQAKNAARAKQLAAKFEQWEPERQSSNNAINMLESEQTSIESTKSLKARFESLQSEQPKEKFRPKVNRFVEQPPATLCAFCDTKVYPLEKIETNGKIFHKNCFRCSYCNCILRMDTYTLNNGHLYCLPHFKQLFISKGNYDEGFGLDQHKRKWEQPVNGDTSS